MDTDKEILSLLSFQELLDLDELATTEGDTDLRLAITMEINIRRGSRAGEEIHMKCRIPPKSS